MGDMINGTRMTHFVLNTPDLRTVWIGVRPYVRRNCLVQNSMEDCCEDVRDPPHLIGQRVSTFYLGSRGLAEVD